MKKLICFLFSVFFVVSPVLASQNSLVVPDGTGAAVRGGFNNGLNTLATLNSGPTAPTTTYPYMLWVDTTNNLLKIMNSANTAWIVVGTPSAANLGLQPALPSGTTSQYLRGDLTMQTYSPMVYPGAGVPNSTGSGWGTSYAVGASANDLVQLNSSGQLPAVSGANLTNLPGYSGISTQTVYVSTNASGTTTNNGGRTFGTVYQNTTGHPLRVDVVAQSGSAAYMVALSDNLGTPETIVDSFSPIGSPNRGRLVFWVLPGNYYEVTFGTGYTITQWTECY